MSKQLFSIFDRAKRPTEDYFERNIAPKLAKDRYKRQVDIASHQLQVAKQKLEALLGDGESLPADHEMAEEVERRVKMITDGDRLIDSCIKLLERWADRSRAIDESTKKYRANLQTAIGEAFPKIQAKLTEIETRNQTELNRLTMDNSRLVLENSELRLAASKVLGAEELSTRLEQFLQGRLDDLQRKLENVVPKASYDQLKKEKERMIDPATYNRLKEEKERMIDPAIHDQLRQDLERLRVEKSTMVDPAVYNHLCQELERLRLEKSTMIDPMVHNQLRDEHALCVRPVPLTSQVLRPSMSRIPSTASLQLGLSPISSSGSYSSPYPPLPQTPVAGIARQMSGSSIASTSLISQSPAASPVSPQQLEPSTHRDQRPPIPTFSDRRPSLPDFGSLSGLSMQGSSSWLSPLGLSGPLVGGQFGGPLRPYSFLISGLLSNGELTQNVAPALLTMMDEQISKWNTQIEKPSWTGRNAASSLRCVDTRRTGLSTKKNPPPDDPNDSIACRRCVRKKQLCVLVGLRGPVIVPLPHSERAASLTPLDLGYYVKE